ncbi:flagellar biosynthetic protein FliO [Myxococcus sp. CA051A]|uniref:flagellar biosynthetic protein FliO n=1 Tax=Myxococcus sp. CA051A TaxID=2741739 RepID=UPI0020C63367|nr:flagellar biosynthetic protein FliO [Myxococcus sp. CA051A]
MAVLRTPLMRLSLGAALLLAPSTVLAQAPSAPAPSATASPVAAVPASSPEAQKSAPPSATAPAVVPASSPEAKKLAPSATAPASADNVRVAAPPSAPSTPVAPAQKAAVVPGSTASTVPPAPAEGSTEASSSAVAGVVPESAPAPEASAASRQKTPGAEPRWEDPALEGAAATEAEAEPESMGWMLIRTLLVLGAVVASIYLTLNVGLRRLMGLQAAAPGKQTVVTVVERLTLDPKRALFVVKAADEYLLVGGGEAGLQLLSKLDSEAVERIRAQRPQTNVVPLSPFLQKLLSRRSGGSSSQPPGA